MAGNEKFYQMAFYSAESGWQRALSWLDGQYPGVTQHLVWDGDRETFVEAVGDLDVEDTDGISLAGDHNTQYYLKIEFVGTAPVPRYSTEFRRLNYRVTSEGKVNPGGTESGIARSVVSVTAGKVFDMGGY